MATLSLGYATLINGCVPASTSLDDPAFKAKPRMLRYRRLLLLTFVLVAVLAMGSHLYTRLETYWNSYVDDEFVADHRWGCYELGVAIRYPKAGILGKSRFWVIVVRDQQGHVVSTIYEGPGAYPDVPVRPQFIAVLGPYVQYDTDELGKHTFHEPLLGRWDCAGNGVSSD